jgi:hypothetical protein
MSKTESVSQKSGPKKNWLIVELYKRADPRPQFKATQEEINSNQTASELLRRCSNAP